MSSASTRVNIERHPIEFVHSISEAGRLLPSSSRWNSIELEYSLFPPSLSTYDSLPSKFSKSVNFDLVITDKKFFKRFLYISALVIFLIISLILLVHFFPRKNHHHGPSKNLTLAVNQALTFFDAQKSGPYPKNSPVKFRGDSGLEDGKFGTVQADLVGGFYDSGNNMKFSFPTAYTVTLLSWSVIEYHQKYSEIGELDHVKDIIKWGTDYLLKLFVPPFNSTSDTRLYSQVGTAGKDTKTPNDMNCWERPEDMDYTRPVSYCDSSKASDLAGEMVAALSAASLVFKEESSDGDQYSEKLVKTAEKLFEVATRKDPSEQGTYTSDIDDKCGKEARQFYNSSGYLDELVWAGTWLFFATGNTSHLEYATQMFTSARSNQTIFDQGLFYWNNKLTANAILLTRLQFFNDLGFPYEDAMSESAAMINSLMCSYVSAPNFNNTTPGGLVIQTVEDGAPLLQFSATASFLSKLYSDYLQALRRSGGSCTDHSFSIEMLRTFSTSQVNYILGDNPMKMSYMVGFGGQYPKQVHHRSASIPWDDQPYTCEDGHKWLQSKDPDPNILVGAMVAGPDQSDKFLDQRDKPWFTQPTISSNVGLVAALIALHDPPLPTHSSSPNLGIDILGLFENIKL
ncbi:endoglucanase 10-like [Humulus lupulus]|uniref:endoglucanase 10-like n=1 Tax=Humulus lupulus TaxID=3486 RepID=UPI002B412C0E|nr:endoglucanase 10-like [Humulus lupulus]